ncbi:MAG: DUF732 domain-containing protein [Mycolicibacterium frederiksbergense]|uniref:DUF732 domain-containing protein n=1 Tax=Mycobacterium adipatum TaxID=1682113 RepID=UPI0027F3551F|nr:DUF732 domain-containing protein [Mycolicibacterium frederiksbergense]
MFTRAQIGQVVAAAVVGGGLLGLAVAPAGAWPIPLTAVENDFLNATRGNFPGNDDQLLLAGKQACRMLYTGQGVQAAIDSTAATYGASPQQAGGLVGAARNTMCTQAPG